MPVPTGADRNRGEIARNAVRKNVDFVLIFILKLILFQKRKKKQGNARYAKLLKLKFLI